MRQGVGTRLVRRDRALGCRGRGETGISLVPGQTFILGPFWALGTVALLGAEPLSQAVQRLGLWAPPQKWNLENLGRVLSRVKSLGWRGAGTRGRKLCGAPGEGSGEWGDVRCVPPGLTRGGQA